MTECSHPLTTTQSYEVVKPATVDGKLCKLKGKHIEVYCMNPQCLRTVSSYYEWDAYPECPD